MPVPTTKQAFAHTDVPSLLHSGGSRARLRLPRTLAAFAAPALVLAGAYAATAHLGAVPPAWRAIQLYGADALLASGAMIAIAFQRGRALLGLAILGLPYVALRYVVDDVTSGFAARTIYGAACVLVPANLGILAALRERGMLNIYGARRCIAILLQVMLVGLVISSRQADATAWAYVRFVEWGWLAHTSVPQLALMVTLLAVTGSVVAWLATRSPINLALGAAALAFGMGANAVADRESFALFIAAAALIIALAVLQDGLRMAFHDELTELRSRRALNERLAGLGGRYAIAMLDVDHFKRVNDLYGHDTGDQVLRMIASRLAHAGRGCIAYRYGGEEFALLFPGHTAEEALPRLEALRRDIAGYALAIRGSDRPRGKRAAQRRRGTQPPPERTLSVTVSIGLAERTVEHPTPHAVLGAADRALYRAKRRGRNVVVQ